MVKKNIIFEHRSILSIAWDALTPSYFAVCKAIEIGIQIGKTQVHIQREGLIPLEFWTGRGLLFAPSCFLEEGIMGDFCAKGGWRVGLRGWKITRSLGGRWGGVRLMLVPFLKKGPSNSGAAPFINDSTR
jgi:hypothetical protein